MICFCVIMQVSCELEFVYMDFQRSDPAGTLAHMTLVLKFEVEVSDHGSLQAHACQTTMIG